MVSCKTRYITDYQTVEVPVIHTELRVDTIRDSVATHDSITVYTKGDTVYNERVKVVEKWNNRTRIINNTDTITKIKPIKTPVPVEVEVEKKLTNWQKAKMALGEVVMILLGAAILHYIYKIYRRWKK